MSFHSELNHFDCHQNDVVDVGISHVHETLSSSVPRDTINEIIKFAACTARIQHTLLESYCCMSMYIYLQNTFSIIKTANMCSHSTIGHWILLLLIAVAQFNSQQYKARKILYTTYSNYNIICSSSLFIASIICEYSLCEYNAY